MISLTPLLKDAITHSAEEAGFSKKMWPWFCRKGQVEGFQDLLGFSLSTYHSGRSVGVHVAVYHPMIEQLYKSIAHVRLSYPLWLLCLNIGYLTPEYRYKNYFFADGTGISAICESIFSDVFQYSNSFYTEYEDIGRLINVYENRRFLGYGDREIKSITFDQQFTILPLLYHLGGNHKKGVELMEGMINDGYKMDDFKKGYFENYCHYEK